MNYYSIQSSRDIIEHHGVKGMKWGRRMANRVKSWMAKQNEKYYDSHNGLLNDYYYQKKKNNIEWKAVQKHTGISLTTGLVFWAGVWIAKQVYWEIMGYK